MKNSSDALANIFFEQCAGSYDGHMAAVPNNPVLFGIVTACSEKRNGPYATTPAEFALMLRKFADSLDPL